MLWRKIPMKRCFPLVSVTALVWLGPSFAQSDEPKEAPQSDRGALAVRGQPALNPAIWPLSGYETAWKAWGLKEKPANYETAFRDRYGVHVPPYDNGGLPMGFHLAPALFGKGLGSDCLLCHGGSVAGKAYIGLGNASLDFQTLYDELWHSSFPLPIRLSNVRGTIEATAVVTFLMEFRNQDLSLRVPKNLKVKDDLCEDIPAWWHMKRKKTMYHTGGGHARSVRTMMPFVLSPLNSAARVKSLEPTFADIQAYLLSLEPPKYPFPIDYTLADDGHGLFKQHCAKCHGTYGRDGKYPSRVVPLETIGTDRRLAEAASPEFIDDYLKSWLAQEKGADGKPFPVQTIRGYQAPPLDGVWATAPYFHNGSAPTVYHVLNSKARPKLFTRSYRTEVDDYDTAKLGLKITMLDQPPDAKMPPSERRKIYDTSQPGRGNRGHTFGDILTEQQRAAVIEYLKTL
jgi:mono/diheme cytochrome c family protein